MACLLRENLRKLFRFRFISTHAHKQPSIIPPTLLSLHMPHVSRTGLDHGPDQIPNWSKSLAPGKEPISDTRLQLYPSFSFEYFLNPNPLSRVNRFLPVDEPVGDESELDDSGKVWADSVKKKRKKKMNKHKYRKLRKRLRRKT